MDKAPIFMRKDIYWAQYCITLHPCAILEKVAEQMVCCTISASLLCFGYVGNTLPHATVELHKHTCMDGPGSLVLHGPNRQQDSAQLAAQSVTWCSPFRGRNCGMVFQHGKTDIAWLVLQCC